MRRGHRQKREARDHASTLPRDKNRARAGLEFAADVAEASERGLIVLRPNGAVRHVTNRAHRWLAEYCGGACSPGTLPAIVRDWLSLEPATGDERWVLSPQKSLILERAGRKLVLRQLHERDSRERVILVEERRTELTPQALVALDLTAREADVLFWVARGKTNRDVAQILGMSPLTVRTHLARIYVKLGVGTRTQAIVVAFEALGLIEP